MWSLDTISRLSREAAREARKAGKEPLVMWEPEDVDALGNGQSIPMLGDLNPKEWRRLKTTFFVDISGFGGEGDPALTMKQFLAQLKAYVAKHPGHGFGMVEHAAFQGYVGVFKRRVKRAKKCVAS